MARPIPRSADTIAALTALKIASLSDNEMVTVLGYSSINDGGGGTFYWDSASGDDADLGTIFQADELGTGRWMRIIEGRQYDARWFDAKADYDSSLRTGTDDTIALQRLIDAVNAAYIDDRGGTAYIPAGSYKFSGLTVKSGVNIVGDGRSNTILFLIGSGAVGLKTPAAASQLAADIVAFGSHQGFWIEPDLGTAAHVQDCIDMTGFTRTTFRDVRLGFAGNKTGIRMTGATLSSSGGPAQWQNDFYSLYLIGDGTGGIAASLGDTSTSFEQIVAWNFYGGRVIANGASVGTGIKLNGVTGVQFFGTVFEGLSDQLLIGSPSGTRGCSGVHLFGCYFEGANDGYTIYANADGVQLHGLFATGVTNTDNGTRTIIVDEGIFQTYAEDSAAGRWRVTMADGTAKPPEFVGSTYPSVSIENDAGTKFWLQNVAASSSADRWVRFLDPASAGQNLLEFGTVNAKFHANNLKLRDSDVGIYTGAGSPESVVTAPAGSFYLNTSGGAGLSIYVKESGAGNTGWIAK